MSADRPDKFQGLRTLARYSGIGLQLVTILGLGVGIGHYLDNKVNEGSQGYTLIGALLGLVVTGYFLFRLTKEFKDSQ